jgi:putative phage-type endonuclease
MTSEEKAQRRQSLGSSDVANLCGVGFLTPLHVYLNKIGEWEQPDSAPMKWGRKLEEVVAVAYMEETGNAVKRPNEKSYKHPEIPWMSASPDFETWVEGEPRVLECKTAKWPDEWGTTGTDEVPDGYTLQVHHQMMVCGWQAAEIAVLIGGSDFRHFTVPRSQRLCDQLLRIEEDFWDRVKARKPPPPDFKHPATFDLLRTMWQADDTISMVLGAEALDIAKRYNLVMERIHELADERETLRNELTFMAMNAGVAMLPEGWKIKRKLVRRGAYSIGPTEYYSFRVIPPKESIP